MFGQIFTTFLRGDYLDSWILSSQWFVCPASLGAFFSPPAVTNEPWFKGPTIY
jgi:hypothetical protein